VVINSPAIMEALYATVPVQISIGVLLGKERALPLPPEPPSPRKKALKPTCKAAKEIKSETNHLVSNFSIDFHHQGHDP
jgi:hypothetical protein